jgi:hypothetical protein
MGNRVSGCTDLMDLLCQRLFCSSEAVEGASNSEDGHGTQHADCICGFVIIKTESFFCLSPIDVSRGIADGSETVVHIFTDLFHVIILSQP